MITLRSRELRGVYRYVLMEGIVRRFPLVLARGSQGQPGGTDIFSRKLICEGTITPVFVGDKIRRLWNALEPLYVYFKHNLITRGEGC